MKVILLATTRHGFLLSRGEGVLLSSEPFSSHPRWALRKASEADMGKQYPPVLAAQSAFHPEPLPGFPKTGIGRMEGYLRGSERKSSCLQPQGTDFSSAGARVFFYPPNLSLPTPAALCGRPARQTLENNTRRCLRRNLPFIPSPWQDFVEYAIN